MDDCFGIYCLDLQGSGHTKVGHKTIGELYLLA
jgi:hypothetical protein